MSIIKIEGIFKALASCHKRWLCEENIYYFEVPSSKGCI